MSDMVIFLVSSTLMMMLRNNGLYAYAATALIIVIEFIVDRRQRSASSNRATTRLLILMALSIVLSLGSTRILKLATGATDGEHQEMLTVPIQQLARTYTYSPEAFTPDEEALLKAFIPEDYLTTYSPRISDVLKSGFNNQYYESHRALFYKLWLTIGARRPLTYLNAHLGTAYGYIYPDALNNVYKGNTMYTFTYTDSSYFGFETEPPGIRDSMLPALELLIEKFSLTLFQQKCPVLSMLFAPGFVFWVFLFVLVGYVDRKNLPMMLLVLMTFATVLFGPTTLVRYVLILWYITPLYPIWIKEAERK